MELIDIVKTWLQDNGYDGLCDGDDCGCPIDDLMPCGEPGMHCMAGYLKKAPPESEIDYFIFPGKG